MKGDIMTGFKVAETLKELRIHMGLTQEAVSQKLNISRQAYSYYESGRRLPDLDTACRLADFFQISLDQLVVKGLHPVHADPFAALPSDYQTLLNTYQILSPEEQKSVRDYSAFLVERKKK